MPYYGVLFHRFWEAIKKWNGALDLNPKDETVYEMKAQVSEMRLKYVKGKH